MQWCIAVDRADQHTFLHQHVLHLLQCNHAVLVCQSIVCSHLHSRCRGKSNVWLHVLPLQILVDEVQVFISEHCSRASLQCIANVVAPGCLDAEPLFRLRHSSKALEDLGLHVVFLNLHHLVHFTLPPLLGLRHLDSKNVIENLHLQCNQLLVLLHNRRLHSKDI